MSEFVAETFVNELDQTINPGDSVIYAGSGWSKTYIARGVFDGVFYDSVYDYNEKKYTPQIVSVRVREVADKRWQSKGYDDEGKYLGGEYVPILRKAILPLKRVYKIDETKIEDFVGKTF